MPVASTSSNTIEEKRHGSCRQAQSRPLPEPSRCIVREDVIPTTGRSKAEIAQLLGISRQHLHDILCERKPVSPSVAVRLGKLFGDGAGVWVRMQGAYDTGMPNAKRT